MGASLITLDDYKTYKGISNDQKDVRTLYLIRNISELVKNYCNRAFVDYVSTDKVEYFDAKTNCVTLKEFPVISVTHVKTSTDGGITQTTLTENDPDKNGYFVDTDNDRVLKQVNTDKFLTSYDTAFRSLEVSYKAGYANGIPLDLQLAVFDAITYYLDNEKTDARAFVGASEDLPPALFTSDFPAHIKRVLNLYRVTYQ